MHAMSIINFQWFFATLYIRWASVLVRKIDQRRFIENGKHMSDPRINIYIHIKAVNKSIN